MEVGDASGATDAWTGDVTVRLAAIAARLDSGGNVVVDDDGAVLYDLAGWIVYEGSWSHRAEFTTPTFDFGVGCTTVEVVSHPELQLSCATDFVPAEAVGRCRESGSQLLICSGLQASDATLVRQDP